jgi:competence protein ComEC
MDVLDRYGVSNLIDNGATGDAIGTVPQNQVHAWLRELGTGVGHRDILAAEIDPTTGTTDEVIDPVGSCDRSPIDPAIRALWGRVTEDLDTYGGNPNNHSIVLRVDFGRASALLVGDMEVLGLARMAQKFAANPGLFDVDLYQVGHHGSRNATVEHFMRAMSPQLAVIPVGPYERDQPWTARAFGHPNRQAIEHLVHRDYGVSLDRPRPKEVWVGVKGAWKDRPSVFERMTIRKAVYAVGWDGTVQVVANASGWFEVHTAR